MIMDLYLAEQEELLEEPLYAGGGFCPAYGPRVDLVDYMTTHGKMPDRDYYSSLLLAEWKRLKYPVDWQELWANHLIFVIQIIQLNFKNI